MKRLSIFLVPMCLILSTHLSLAQRAVTVGGGWQFFEWNNAPGSFNIEGAFTFTSASSTLLTITDTGVDGDRFTLFDFGTLLGTTSMPANDGYDNETLTPDQALADPRYSHGFFPLSPGSHSITIQIIEAARGYSGGGADFRVDVVPEPATLSFLAVAVGISAFCRRR